MPRISEPSNGAAAAAPATAPPAADVKVDVDDDWDMPGDDVKAKLTAPAQPAPEAAAKSSPEALGAEKSPAASAAQSTKAAETVEAADAADEDENTGEIAAAEALADELSDADKTTHYSRPDEDGSDPNAARSASGGMDLKALASLPTLRSAPPAPPGFGSKPPGQLAVPLPPPPSMPPTKSVPPPSRKSATPQALLGSSGAPPPPPPPSLAPPSARASQHSVSRPPMPTPDAMASSISPAEFQRASYAPQQPPRSRVLQISALALLVGGLLGLVIVLLVRPNALAGGANGSVVVTVSGEGNTPIDQLVILADDVARCETSPCRVGELGAGTHFIRVTAPGYVTTAARAIAVEEGNEGVLHIQLTPVAGGVAKAEPASASTPQANANAVSKPTQGTTERAAQAPAGPTRGAVVDPRAKKDDKKGAKVAEAPKSGAPGKLNINSIPSTNVVLDGRPVGRTPITGLSVSPGAHTIVFIHPESGRKVQSTTVEPGATRNVGVRF
jgi:hypothetical protein